MTDQELSTLQLLTTEHASALGHHAGLFGMILNDITWKDGDDYYYWPKGKNVSDFTFEDCIKTLQHIADWHRKELGYES